MSIVLMQFSLGTTQFYVNVRRENSFDTDMKGRLLQQLLFVWIEKGQWECDKKNPKL